MLYMPTPRQEKNAGYASPLYRMMVKPTAEANQEKD